MLNFKSFNFHPNVAAGVVAAGYVTPTPIQARAIPQVLKNHDVMGLAQTGTGKTAVFVLPGSQDPPEKHYCLRWRWY
jgi:ATP-dependent RNA helicase RhlE